MLVGTDVCVRMVSLQMRRQVMQVQKPWQVWYVSQAEEQAENNLKHQYIKAK